MYQPTAKVAAMAAGVKDLMVRGLYEETLNLFRDRIHPLLVLPLFSVSFILPSVIKASSHSQPYHYHYGLQLHSLALKTGTDQDPTVSNSILTMYVRFYNIQLARKVFDTMPERDTITWNSMINGYIQNGRFADGLKTFKDMLFSGYEPKPELIASVLSVCARCEAFRLGREIHALLTVNDLNRDSAFVSTALIDFYFRCRNSTMALRVFDTMEVRNEAPWTAVISGCAAAGNYSMALDYFRAMQEEEEEEIKPNRVTLITILPVCTELNSIRNGKQIHAYAIRFGLDSDASIVSSLIDVYGNHLELLPQARLIFDRSTHKDIVTWSSILSSHSKFETTAEETFILFRQMRMNGTNPNSVTMLAILSACSTLSVLSRALVSHAIVLKTGFGFHLFINNSLINMYSKCGSLVDSRKVFDEMPERDNFSWSAIIGAYGLNGCGKLALLLYDEMQAKGVNPDEITFLSILSACNHAGLVKEGKKIFDRIKFEGKITLTLEHYACYVDLLGKAGLLEEACEAIEKMGMKPNMKIWSCLVSACKVHGRLEVAERLGKKVIELEPENGGFYTLLCMVYAELGNWVGVEELRMVMRMKGLKKCQGFSWICL